MTAQAITQSAVHFGLVVLSVAFLLTVWRVIRGPTLPDRVIALDMLVGIVMGFIALIAIRTGYTLYIDIAISLGLVGFLATVALARFILSRKRREGEDGSPPEPLPERPDATVEQPATPASIPTASVASEAPEPVPAGTATPVAAPAATARPSPSKSEVTKASAAKVKIAKAKARGKAAGADQTASASAAAAAPAKPKPPRKPAAKPAAKKETP